MKRREFLMHNIKALAMIMILGKSGASASQLPQGNNYQYADGHITVSLAGVNNTATDHAMRSAVRAGAEAATDFSWLSKGDVVFIKPALNSGNPYPATTSPIAVGAMIEILQEKGAGRIIVGDMSGIEYVKLSATGLTGSTRRLMEASGMAKVVTSAGAEMHFFEESGWGSFYEDMPAVNSYWKNGLMMPNILRDVDHIILMPRCARHVLTGSTLGLKAAVGYWRTDTRLEYHHDASTLQEKTAEGNSVGTLIGKQRLVISAADKVLTTFGPDKGYIYKPQIGLVIASESVVAHDMVSLAWLLENRRYIPLSEKDWFKDLYNSQFIVSIANHVVVQKLGGMEPAFSSEKLTRNNISTIWDDRVLNHAYRVFGGMPRISMKAANIELPEHIRKRLIEMTMSPQLRKSA
jgi:uncharacterized protein (DUF362 family)